MVGRQSPWTPWGLAPKKSKKISFFLFFLEIFSNDFYYIHVLLVSKNTLIGSRVNTHINHHTYIIWEIGEDYRLLMFSVSI